MADNTGNAVLRPHNCRLSIVINQLDSRLAGEQAIELEKSRLDTVFLLPVTSFEPCGRSRRIPAREGAERATAKRDCVFDRTSALLFVLPSGACERSNSS